MSSVKRLMGGNFGDGAGSAFAPAADTWTDVGLFSPGVPLDFAVPAGAKYAVFNSDVVFFVNLSATASVPAAQSVDGTGAMCSPAARQVTSGSTISIISPSAGYISVSFYA